MVHYEKKTKLIITDKRCFMDMCVNQTKAETNETKKIKKHIYAYTQPTTETTFRCSITCW